MKESLTWNIQILPLNSTIDQNVFICIVRLTLLISYPYSLWKIKKTCLVEASTSNKHSRVAWFYLERWFMGAIWFQQYLWWLPVVSRWPCKYNFVSVLADGRLCCKNCVYKTCLQTILIVVLIVVLRFVLEIINKNILST